MSRLLLFWVIAIALHREPADILAQTLVPVLLEGSVRDVYTRNGYLQGATIIVTSHRTGKVVTATTDSSGRFQLPLDPGTYTLSVAIAGYGSLVDKQFCVIAGQPARFDAALGPDRGNSRVAPRTIPETPDVDAPVYDPGSPSMTIGEIQEAMAFGRTAAKLKAPALSESGVLIGRRTGLIFTPFWRVATMTQVAAARKEQFNAGEVPEALTQNLVWIVGNPTVHYVNDHGDMDSPQYLSAVSQVTVLDKRGTVAREMNPRWTMRVRTACDVTTLETLMGRQFTHPSLIAAFPTDAINPGNVIVFRYSSFAGLREGHGGIKIKEELRRVSIKKGDLRNWK